MTDTIATQSSDLFEKIMTQRKIMSERAKAFKEKTTFRQRYEAWCDMHPWDEEARIYDV